MHYNFLRKYHRVVVAEHGFLEGYVLELGFDRLVPLEQKRGIALGEIEAFGKRILGNPANNEAAAGPPIENEASELHRLRLVVKNCLGIENNLHDALPKEIETLKSCGIPATWEMSEGQQSFYELSPCGGREKKFL
jgi:hypothetical protein